LLFLSIGLTILYLAYLKQNKAYEAECALLGIAADDCDLMGKVIYDIVHAKFFWIFVILGAYVLSNIIRARRWLMLIQPMGYNAGFLNSFLSIMLGYFANLGLPRVGEFIRAATLAKYEHIPAEKLIGTIVTERVIDVICLGIVILLALFFEYELLWNFISNNQSFGESITKWFANPIFWMILVGFILGGAWLYSQDSFRNHRIVLKIKEIIKGFAEGLKSVFALKRPFLFIGYSLTIWLLYYLMTYLCFFSFAPTAHLGLKAGLVIFTFGTLGIVIPSPGGLGTYQFLISEALKIYDISAGDSFSFANIIFFSIQIFCNILLGIIALIMLPLVNKNEKEPNTKT